MFALNGPEIRIDCEMEGQPDEDRHGFVQVHLKDALCDFSIYIEDCDPGEESRLGWLYIEKLAFTLSKASFNNFCSLSLPKEDLDIQLNRYKGEIQVIIEDHGDNVDIAISPFRCLNLSFDGRIVPYDGQRGDLDWESNFGWSLRFMTDQQFLQAIQNMARFPSIGTGQLY